MYGKATTFESPSDDDIKAGIQKLTDITEDFDVVCTWGGNTNSSQNTDNRKLYIIKQFEYTSNTTNKKATWYQEGATVKGETIPAGGWYVEDLNQSSGD